METAPPLPVVLTLTALIDGLLEAAAARYGIYPIRGPVLLFLWKRFSRVKQLFARIAARVAAGKSFATRPPRPRAARASPRPPRDAQAFRITKWLRPDFGWLCRVVPGPAGAPAFAGQLRDLLAADPAMQALLAATPATARALRPLCRMLGVREPPPVVLSAAPPAAIPPTSAAPAHVTHARAAPSWAGGDLTPGEAPAHASVSPPQPAMVAVSAR